MLTVVHTYIYFKYWLYSSITTPGSFHKSESVLSLWQCYHKNWPGSSVVLCWMLAHNFEHSCSARVNDQCPGLVRTEGGSLALALERSVQAARQLLPRSPLPQWLPLSLLPAYRLSAPLTALLFQAFLYFSHKRAMSRQPHNRRV